MPSTPPKVLTVSQVAALVRGAIEDACGALWVEGEVSGVRTYPSGHTYFTLKDAESQLNVAYFANAARTAGNVMPREGTKVRVYGRITAHPKKSEFQAIAQRVVLAGIGDLMMRFEELKRRLAAEGLFDPSRKRPIPVLPRRIGVVTSPAGAAIRDVLSVVGRRFPNLHIVIAPSRVQGQGAEDEIAAAIDLLNSAGGPDRPADSPCPPLDVLLVTRGGGSIEDLWCFNGEPVVRAIARSKIPVISAVGHEIDTTLSDLAADLRAATPSAAAELLVGRKNDFEAGLAETSRRIARAVGQGIALLRGRLDAARVNRVFAEPRHAVERAAQRIDWLGAAMEGACRERLAALRRRCDAAAATLSTRRASQVPRIRVRLADLQGRLRHAAALAGERAGRRLESASARLRALNPLAVLERGYSLTRLADGAILVDAAQAVPGARLSTRLARGEVVSYVGDAPSAAPRAPDAPPSPPRRQRPRRDASAGPFLPGLG